jgi:hypothetical protein
MPSKYGGYGVSFYFSGLSLRKAAADRLSDCVIKRNHVYIGIGFKTNPQWISSLRKRKSL